MKRFGITPDFVRGLSYYSKCKLSDYLNVVNPMEVTVIGSLVLDDFGNFISADAFVLERCPVFQVFWPAH